MNVLSIEDLETGQIIQSINGIYPVDELAANEKRTFKITADYNNCSNSSLEVYSGYSCGGYPASFAAVSCPYTQFQLSVIPQTSELQIRTTDLYDPNDPCSNNFSAVSYTHLTLPTKA